jgi:hypothetical protein
MSASVEEVARPTLRVRGLLGRTKPILITGGRAWQIIGKYLSESMWPS